MAGGRRGRERSGGLRRRRRLRSYLEAFLARRRLCSFFPGPSAEHNGVGVFMHRVSPSILNLICPGLWSCTIPKLGLFMPGCVVNCVFQSRSTHRRSRIDSPSLTFNVCRSGVSHRSDFNLLPAPSSACPAYPAGPVYYIPQNKSKGRVRCGGVGR